MAKYLISQYGGPDGELSAAYRYLNQRYTMPTCKSKGLLTDIGTEEMAHVEIIATMAHQLMENASIKELEEAGLGGHYVDHKKQHFIQMLQVMLLFPNCIGIQLGMIKFYKKSLINFIIFYRLNNISN